MKEFKKRDSSGILPLSSNPELDRKSIPGIDAYYSDLNNAFKNPRVRNIAVTGQHGVGKSSLIKSFDATQRSLFRRKPKFLYVSLGQYTSLDVSAKAEPPVANQPSYVGKLTDGVEEFKITLDALPKPTEKETDNSMQRHNTLDEQNAIERRMLLQLCSKFEDRYFPASGLRLIPKQPGMLRTSFFVLFSMAIMLLMMKTSLAELLVNWVPRHEVVERVLKFILDWNECIEIFLYGVAILGAAVIFCEGFKWLWLRGRRSRFVVKTNNAEWNLGENTCEDYLDQYTQELVYCLSSVGKKIDYTVVFEDMDRLDTELCNPIFTRLREINHLLNAHMKGGKYIRFVFAVREDAVVSLDYNKFFDFTLPVIPTLNRQSAEVIFKENLLKVNTDLAQAIKKERLREHVGTVGAHMIVYLDRHPVLGELCCWLQEKAVVNDTVDFEAGSFANIELTKESEPCFLERIKQKRVVGHFFCWLTRFNCRVVDFLNKVGNLLTYKENIWNCPGCECDADGYCKCISGTESKTMDIVQLAARAVTDYRKMFTILNEYSLTMRMNFRSNLDKRPCEEAERILAFYIYKHLWPEDYKNLIGNEGKPSFLTGRAIGEEKGAQKELLQAFIDKKLLSINSLDFAGFSRSKIAAIWKTRLNHGDDLAVLEAMEKAEGYRNADLVHIIQSYCSVKDPENDEIDSRFLKKAICFMLRVPHAQPSANDWFFRDRDSDKCLGVLASLNDNDAKIFIALCKMDQKRNIYQACRKMGGKLVHDSKWTEEMARMFVLGVPSGDPTRTVGSVRLKNGEIFEFDKNDK